MNATIVSKEKSNVKFSFEISAEVLESGMSHAYQKAKGRLSMPGFRKGKVPRKLIEAEYGEGFFYEDAINFIFPQEYGKAVEELGLEPVSRPTLDVEYIGSGKGAKFVVDVIVKPEVTLGQYKGLEVEKDSVEVTEEEVLNEIKKSQDKNARMVEVTGRPAQMGDTAKISYEGFQDGVAFAGGQADEYDLELGSHHFIEGFEEQIVGHNVGDAFDVNVTFPEAYQAPELAGKPAVFKVELKGLTEKELPELNDAFAEDVSDFSTMEEYKNDVKSKLVAAKEAKAVKAMEDKLLDMAVSNATMEVPEVMYENKVDSMMSDFEQNMANQGISMDLYFQYTGSSEEQLKANMEPTAKKSVDARLVLEAIAAAEDIQISKEELDEEIGGYGASFGLSAEDTVKMFGAEQRKLVEDDMKVRAAAKLINESAVVK